MEQNEVKIGMLCIDPLNKEILIIIDNGQGFTWMSQPKVFNLTLQKFHHYSIDWMVPL